jgi:translin
VTESRLSSELARLGAEARAHLEATHRAREEALARCREVIRSSGLAIRSVHRLDSEAVSERLEEAESALRKAQDVLVPFPSLSAAGFLHDAEKEYAEARLTIALVDGDPLPGFEMLNVGMAAWLNGLAEAASELRRHLLDRLRRGQVTRGEELLMAMEDAYDLLVSIEYPDAITGGLRRTTDALRAVLERSRSDVTATVLQTSLKEAIERSLGGSPAE